ncbi:MAG: hypothetical protein M3524_12480 [Actinomycetota bacterium]|nr:hypothetical protein [Actinomycetota bacterium]
MSLAEGGQASGGLLIPAELGPPDEVYLDDRIPGGLVTLVYRASADLPPVGQTDVGALVGQFSGRTQRDFLHKIVLEGATVEAVDVGRVRGYWISGGPHALVYLDASGEMRWETFRLAGDALVFTRGTQTVRLETGLSKDEAVALAESLEPR